MDEIKTICFYCDKEYTSHIQIDSGGIQDWCCSEECYLDYHSIEKVRERKLEKILKCI